MDAVKQLMTEAAEATLRGDADAVAKATAALAELGAVHRREADHVPMPEGYGVAVAESKKEKKSCHG